jgi:DNA polymerase-3 subunit delta'
MIDPADRMNVSAANALLKTLEEPATSTIIVLIADDPARLPATIRSRCQRIAIGMPSRD